MELLGSILLYRFVSATLWLFLAKTESNLSWVIGIFKNMTKLWTQSPKICTCQYTLDFVYNFRALWAPKSICVFQVQPSVMVNPLLTGISFYKIKCLLNSHGSEWTNLNKLCFISSVSIAYQCPSENLALLCSSNWCQMSLINPHLKSHMYTHELIFFF